MAPDGVMIGYAQHGVPKKDAPNQQGASQCTTGATLRRLLENLFHNVFIFSMNDEMVHTGFAPMAHYLIGMGCGRRR